MGKTKVSVHLLNTNIKIRLQSLERLIFHLDQALKLIFLLLYSKTVGHLVFHLLVQFNHPEYFVTALAHRSGAKDVSSEVRYYRKSGDLQIGTEFLYNYTTAATAATVGVAKSCEIGVVKAVVGTSGVVGLSWKKRLDANTEVIVGCNADVQRKEYQVGFNLNVTA